MDDDSEVVLFSAVAVDGDDDVNNDENNEEESDGDKWSNIIDPDENGGKAESEVTADEVGVDAEDTSARETSEIIST